MKILNLERSIKQSGVYILNPDVMHYGGIGNKITILKVFRDLK